MRVTRDGATPVAASVRRFRLRVTGDLDQAARPCYDLSRDIGQLVLTDIGSSRRRCRLLIHNSAGNGGPRTAL